MEKRKILGIGKESAWHKDRWLIGQIAEIKHVHTHKGGVCSASMYVKQPRIGRVNIFSCAVKLSKRRY